MKCTELNCEVKPKFHFTRIESRGIVSEGYMCEEHMRYYFRKYRSMKSIEENKLTAPIGTVCADFDLMIWDYSLDPKDTPCILYMREVGGTRYLCTRMDAWAWSTLTAQFYQRTEPRPVSHEGWADSIRILGGQLQDVIVDKLDEADNWFHAVLRIIQNSQMKTVNVRASDGYVLSLVFGKQVYIDEKLMVNLLIDLDIDGANSD